MVERNTTPHLGHSPSGADLPPEGPHSGIHTLGHTAAGTFKVSPNAGGCRSGGIFFLEC